MIQLRSGTIGTARAGCHVLEMIELTGESGGTTKIQTDLEALAERLYMNGSYWGDKNNAVVIVVDKEAEPWTAALAMGTIAQHDESPVATLLNRLQERRPSHLHLRRRQRDGDRRENRVRNRRAVGTCNGTQTERYCRSPNGTRLGKRNKAERDLKRSRKTMGRGRPNLPGMELPAALKEWTGMGIDEQETAGQRALLGSGARQLPRESNVEQASVASRTGIVFHDEVDELFVNATLPDGWKIVACDDARHSELLDEKGTVQAEIFYKAVQYDRRADITWRT